MWRHPAVAETINFLLLYVILLFFFNLGGCKYTKHTITYGSISVSNHPINLKKIQYHIEHCFVIKEMPFCWVLHRLWKHQWVPVKIPCRNGTPTARRSERWENCVCMNSYNFNALTIKQQRTFHLWRRRNVVNVAIDTVVNSLPCHLFISTY